MDITELTDLEVNQLINSVKKCERSIPGETPLIGRIKDDTPVLDFENHIKYILHRYRHPFDASRFSLHIRFTDTNDILIRVDIHNGTHKNPDGTVVGQNHMHIYHNQDGLRKDASAIPLPDEIHDISTLFIALDEFLNYTNTKPYDSVSN
ncbi:DUF6978 family protein [Lactiplantibacillus daowaiensis]|uniref:DUF6978 family protein n=1 Tax=Lactiplantibacillus daowaiensis TaxID=2559918 RepID=A0ABW1RWT3_9LACO